MDATLRVISRAGTKHSVEVVADDGTVLNLKGVSKFSIHVKPDDIVRLSIECIEFIDDIKDLRSHP